MGRANVYLPDELEARVKAAQIPISEVCQRALLAAVEAAEGPPSPLGQAVTDQFRQGWAAGVHWAGSAPAEPLLTLLRDQRLDEIPGAALPDDLYSLTQEQTVAWEAGFVDAARATVRAALPGDPSQASSGRSPDAASTTTEPDAEPGSTPPSNSAANATADEETAALGDDSDCRIGQTVDGDRVCFDPHSAVRGDKSPLFAILGHPDLRAHLALSIAQDAAARGSAVVLADLSGQLTSRARGLGKTVRIIRPSAPPIPPLEELISGATSLSGLWETLSRIAPAGGLSDLFVRPAEELLEPGYVTVLALTGDGPLAAAISLAQAAQAMSRLGTRVDYPRLLHIDLPGGISIPGGLGGRLGQIVRTAREHNSALGLSADSADTVTHLGGRGALLSTVFAFATSDPLEAERLRDLLGAGAPILLNAPGTTTEPSDPPWAVMRDLHGRLGQVRIDR